MQQIRRRLFFGMTFVSLLSAALPAAAQSDPNACDAPARPITPAEKKLFEDSSAMFLRMAPPAPAGWTAVDSRKEKTLTFICGPDIFTRFSFSRTFNRNVDQARSDAALRKIEAINAQGEARRNANEAKLADIDRRAEELAKRIGTLAEQGKFAELGALSGQSDKLAAEREALTSDPAAEAAVNAAGAEVSRDTTAIFTLVVGEEGQISSAFKPMASGVGTGYRQDGQDKDGNPSVDLLIVLPRVPGVGGDTRVMITGDPARADGLLTATNFR